MASTSVPNDPAWLLEDAIELYRIGRKRGSILLLACAVDALAQRRNPQNSNNRERYVNFLKEKMRRPGRAQIHNQWVPRLGRALEFEFLFYKFLRCPLVHEGSTLEAAAPDVYVCLDWENPWQINTDHSSNVVFLGGEFAFDVLSDAVAHELAMIAAQA